MNLNKLIEKTLRITKGYNADVETIKDFINDAYFDLVELGKLQKTVTITTTKDIYEYDLPMDFKAPGLLVKGNLSEPEESLRLLNIDENKPGFACFDGKLYMKPTPTDTITYILSYYYSVQPLENNTDIPVINDQYHRLLPIYAAGMVLTSPEGIDTVIKNKSSVRSLTVLGDRLMNQWEGERKSYANAMLRGHKRGSVRERVVW